MLQQSRYLYLLIPPKTEAYGEDLLYVSRQMGHSSLSVTGEICAHQNPGTKTRGRRENGRNDFWIAPGSPFPFGSFLQLFCTADFSWVVISHFTSQDPGAGITHLITVILAWIQKRLHL
jgi:hypothetical protein